MDSNSTMAYSIPESFRNATVLITGGTGFLGKVLTEKLLRSCPDLKQVYLLARDKKGKSMHERLEVIFQDPLFSVLEKEQPKYRHKIKAIRGDVEERGLGLSEEDRQTLIQEVGVVFHGAATVRFDETIRTVYNINVRGTIEMLTLAMEIKNLKSFVHISTAYSNCHLDAIDEQLYDAPMDYNTFSEIMESIEDDKLLNALSPKLLRELPNTYVFSKSIAEHIVAERSKLLPVNIFRPSIVISTAHEPVTGWTDNVFGPNGIVIGAACGVLRTMQLDRNCVADMVPVDMTVNALIASAWESMNHSSTTQPLNNPVQDADQVPPVYNYVSSVENPITWGDYIKYIERHGLSAPIMKAMWYYFFTVHNTWFMHMICVYFLHYLPALIIDGIAKITRKESPNLFRIYKKIDKFTAVISYYTTRQWKFSNNNVQTLWSRLSAEDKITFNFDIKQIDWDKVFYNFIHGGRVYLLKEDMSTLPQAKARWRNNFILYNSRELCMRKRWNVYRLLKDLPFISVTYSTALMEALWSRCKKCSNEM